MNHVLVVDDEAPMRAALEATLLRDGWSVMTAAGVDEAMEKFRMAPCPLVITDMRMPDGDGLRVMQGVREIAPGTAVVLLTAFGSIPEAVLTMKEGACDYLMKPISFDQLSEAARRLLGHDESAPGDGAEHGIVGRSAAFRRMLARARQVAASDVDVLIEAESGTGKELLARMIHRLSLRRRGPFVAVNCASFPETLLESELFGHVRGAFTGATTAKPGKFELANGGTLLLDEVGEMPLSLQPKLLRVLQEREVDRLGDTRPAPVDVRVVATTNRQLKAMVADGRFRGDLFYRLNVVPVTIPPLRERREDIAELAQHFLEKHAGRSGGRLPMLSPELVQRLEAHAWPGNVRELENFIRRALALATGPRLGPELAEDWDADEAAPPAKAMAAGASEGVSIGTGGISLREMERQLLEQTLESTDGNRTRAAEILGISIRTMRNKIKEYGLPPREAS
ncbi:MAG: sigma-54-dependent Fis family transcriptional regulator [Acidobacteriota bacterium]|nr:sigma-54-dependent Fis family transcriptional regulator [Acidobacteriota bacterium]